MSKSKPSHYNMKNKAQSDPQGSLFFFNNLACCSETLWDQTSTQIKFDPLRFFNILCQVRLDLEHHRDKTCTIKSNDNIWFCCVY